MGERRGLKFVWRTTPRAPRDLFDAFNDADPQLTPALVQVLYARGLGSRDECLDFLAGAYRDADDPLLLADMPRVVHRLVRAGELGERVTVFTDYDADGVNAAAVLATGLPLVGIKPAIRLPNRFRDGYGLSVAVVEELAQLGTAVIVTADCGSSSHAAALRARELGVDLIVTDHHQLSGDLPEAYAVVNPWRPDCAYPFDYLCGAGVAYKLLQALADAVHPQGRPVMEPLLDLVALATVADIMPLVGENRRLVLAGLAIMNAFPRPGVRALIEVAGLEPGQVDAAALGFRVAPRVNAAGRLDDPGIAFRLLMSEDWEEARALALEIDGLNRERQQVTKELQARAGLLVQPRLDAGAFTLVCGGEGWPAGVVGLVAGKLAQTHVRPSLVYTVRDGVASGSGRGIQGFDLLAALRACDAATNGREGLFERYGGHHAAAGFTLPATRLPALEERFEAAAREVLTAEQLQAVLVLDGYLRPETLTFEFARALERLAPFGAGFKSPSFAMKDLEVVESRPVGAEDGHWKLRLRPIGTRSFPFSAIAFGQGPLAARFTPGSRLDAAFHVRCDRYRDAWRLELEVLDVADATATSAA